MTYTVPRRETERGGGGGGGFSGSMGVRPPGRARSAAEQVFYTRMCLLQTF